MSLGLVDMLSVTAVVLCLVRYLFCFFFFTRVEEIFDMCFLFDFLISNVIIRNTYLYFALNAALCLAAIYSHLRVNHSHIYLVPLV